jgi:hypothetical protein
MKYKLENGDQEYSSPIPKSLWSKLENGEIASHEALCDEALRNEIDCLRSELTHTKKEMESLEVKLFNEYEKKLMQQREFMVMMIDKFLADVGSEAKQQSIKAMPRSEIFNKAMNPTPKIEFNL